MIRLGPLGDRGFLARFASEGEAAAWAEAVRSRTLPGVVDVVAAYATAAVFADPELADLESLEAILRTEAPSRERRSAGVLHELPVLYDGEDLPDVARRLGLSESGVIEAHAGSEYRVFAIGFQPGFPYAGELPPILSGLSRRDSPRVRVPAGSVAMVGRQTAIYPAPSPGGWHLIGRTPLRIVDLLAGEFPIRVGDRLRFVPIDPREFEARKEEPLCSRRPGLSTSMPILGRASHSTRNSSSA